MTRAWRRYVPLAVMLAVVLGMGAVGLRFSAAANDRAESIHRADRRAHEATLASLTNQYFQFTFKEAYDVALLTPWTLLPGDEGDRAALEAFVRRSPLLDHGAALVSLDRQPLTAYAEDPGLPDATDPGYAALVAELESGRPGLSSVMRVGPTGVPVVAVGVPVMVEGSPRALLIAYFKAAGSALQRYSERLGLSGTGYIIDSTGVVAASQRRALMGAKVGNDAVLAELSRGRAGFVEIDSGDERKVVAYNPVGVAGWAAIREEPASTFYGPIRDSQQRVHAWLLALLGVSAVGLAVLQQRVESARRRSDARFRALVQHAADIITVVDEKGTILYDSPAVERVLGYATGERVGQDGLAQLHPDEVETAYELLGDLVQNPGSGPIRAEFRVARKDGTWAWLEVSASNLLHEPGIRGLVVNLRDISERREFQEQLAHQAFHDALTGLPNRTLFHDRLDVALARVRRSSGQVAVLFLDLDRFKLVNDSLGHEVGDKVLVAVAARLEDCVREQDTLARMSGDEFTILVDDIDDLSQAVHVADRVIEALRTPFAVGEREIFVGASIGIALSGAGDAAEDLIRKADLAMYRAKEKGRLRYEVFAADLSDRAKHRLELEGDLRQALSRDELRLYYQPEVDLADGRVTGVEALLRWDHPRLGHLLPGHFVPLAEETGLILPLGEWVLDEACRQLRSWKDAGVADPSLTMSVNVSGRQLQQHGALVDAVGTALTDHGVEPRNLKLEITESVLMDDAEAAIGTLRALRGIGVELAIDDFGTGYSSLSYLKHFPVSTLKLDRSFVHGLSDDSADAAIAWAMIGLAHSLGITVTAEGIELRDQLETLRAMRCDSGQGYYLSKPAPPEEALRLLRVRVTDVR